MSEQLTVRELIELLEAVEDKDMKVMVEGCDCIGDCDGLIIEPGYEGRIKHEPPYVLLTRN